MNIIAVSTALFPLGTLEAIIQMCACAHFGMVALLLFPVLIYCGTGLLFYIGLAWESDSDMSLLGLPILVFLWGYLIAVGSEKLVLLCHKKDTLNVSK